MIRIVASARRDLDEGFQFYESQEIGLGDYFLSSVKADVESLKFTAGVHRIACADYRRGSQGWAAIGERIRWAQIQASHRAEA